MKIRIHWNTTYRYETEVSFSPHVFRLFPRPDQFVTVGGVDFSTSPDADVQQRKDIFDNNVAACFYPRPGRELAAQLDMELELREKNAFHFLLESHALEFPFDYKLSELRLLAPYLDGGVVSLPFWQPERGPTVPALVAMNDAIFKNIKYERRDEGPARKPSETLALGVGACRDYAVLLAAALRANGVAARLASGYLCEFDAREKRAEGSLHAWTEAYLPGAGWVGMDPTNGVFCGESHITAAVGCGPEDIAPVSGSYFGDRVVASNMEATLEMFKCDE
jgi:transglutaminase-like putative cysteine protease